MRAKGEKAAGKKGRKVLWTVLIVICAAVFLVSGGMLLHYGLEYHQIDSDNEQVAQLLEQQPTQEQVRLCRKVPRRKRRRLIPPIRIL